MTTRVLIADDQSMVRRGFRMIMDAEPDLEVVAEAADGEQAMAACAALHAACGADGHPDADHGRVRGHPPDPRRARRRCG